MTNAFLTVKFFHDADGPGTILNRSHHEDRLRSAYFNDGIRVVGLRTMSNTRYHLLAEVHFDAAKGTAPLKAFVRERAKLAIRTLLGEQAAVGFEIEKLTIDDIEYNPVELLLGYREDPATTLYIIDQAIVGHPNAEIVAGWLKELVNTERHTTAGLMTIIGRVLKDGHHRFDAAGEEGFMEFLERDVPNLAKCVRSDFGELPGRAVWNHLITAAGVLEKVSASYLAADSIEPDVIVRQLYSKFTRSEEAAATRGQVKRLLSAYPAPTQSGVMFRFRLFVAAQLGMEAMVNRGGAANLGELHELLGLTFDSVTRDHMLV